MILKVFMFFFLNHEGVKRHKELIKSLVNLHALMVSYFLNH